MLSDVQFENKSSQDNCTKLTGSKDSRTCHVYVRKRLQQLSCQSALAKNKFKVPQECDDEIKFQKYRLETWILRPVFLKETYFVELNYFQTLLKTEQNNPYLKKDLNGENTYVRALESKYCNINGHSYRLDFCVKICMEPLPPPP